MRIIDLPLPAQVVLQLHFMPDNRSVLALSDDGSVVMLSAVDGDCKAVLEVSCTNKVQGSTTPFCFPSLSA